MVSEPMILMVLSRGGLVQPDTNSENKTKSGSILNFFIVIPMLSRLKFSLNPKSRNIISVRTANRGEIHRKSVSAGIFPEYDRTLKRCYKETGNLSAQI